MRTFQALRIGLKKVNQSRRMVVFAWLVNAFLSLTVALPLLSPLGSTIGNTVTEERLLGQIDANWFQTFKADNQANELARLFDYTILGYAPFLAHSESLVAGTVVKTIGMFFFDLIFRFRLSTGLNVLVILAFVYLLSSTFLAGGFIGMYAKPYRLSFNEFLIESSKYFGRFFRLSLLSLVFLTVFFEFVFDPWSKGIAAWTVDAQTEMTPFVHYMVKNAVVLLTLVLLNLCLEYARIRIVVDDRVSALFAAWAGARFVFNHFASTAGLYILLMVLSLAGVVVYAFAEQAIDQTGYWTILLVFILQQAYMIVHFWLKASFYSSQTQLYQSASSGSQGGGLAR